MTRFARLAAIVGLAIVVPVVRSVRLQAAADTAEGRLEPATTWL